MSSDVCTRCGRPLVAGACPLGHPQRSVRRRRRRWRVPTSLLLVMLLAAAVAYAALVWYPVRAAEEAMVPASRDFAAVMEPLGETVGAFPDNGDPESLARASAVLEVADDARIQIGRAQLRLEDATPPSIPVLSNRPPLRIAAATHDDLEELYVSALELVGNVEALARYLTQLAPILPNLDNLETALGEQATPGEIERATAAALPIAQQVQADVRALSAPEQVSATHASLLAIARGIRSSIEDLGELGGEADEPVARAVLEDIASQLESFRETATGMPSAARDGGLADQIASVEAVAAEVVARLRELMAEGVEGLAIPAGPSLR